MPPVKRGYQGKCRFRLYDLESEGYRDLTTDEVQTAFMRIEMMQTGELPEMCKNCTHRTFDQSTGKSE